MTNEVSEIDKELRNQYLISYSPHAGIAQIKTNTSTQRRGRAETSFPSPLIAMTCFLFLSHK